MEKENQNNLCFWGWGNVSHSFDSTISSRFLAELQKRFVIEKLSEKQAVPSIENYLIPPSELPQAFIQAWEDKGLTQNPFERLIHSGGKSYKDLLRVRYRQLSRYPDGVLYLEQAEDLPALFEDALKFGITLIPFGGGTGVVGGTDALGPKDKPILTLDLKKLNRLLTIDDVSLTAKFQAGILGPDLEKILNVKGYTLGHFPQSFEFSTLGGWVATRSAGQNSTKYGKIEKLVSQVVCYSPKGKIETRLVPSHATGPSLQDILVGSEGLYGILTEATVKISKIPECQEFITGFFKDFQSGIQAFRTAIQSGVKPSVLRLSDPDETNLFLHINIASSFKRKLLGGILRFKKIGDQPCYFLVGFEGSEAEVKFHQSKFKKIVRQHSGFLFGRRTSYKQGHHWLKNRFELPYLRDPLMDRSIFIDTLETAAPWSKLAGLYQGMTQAFLEREKQSGEKWIAGCHVSHAYPDGASLYFTILGVQRKGQEIKQWQEIKSMACDIIMEHGGTISHHHGVGRDHRPWMEKEKSQLGLEVLKQIKQELDPDQILNPEKLF